MIRYALATVAVGIAVAGCSGGPTATHPHTAKPVPPAELEGLLLDAGEIDSVMGTTGMTVHQAFSTMEDHRNLLPNLNCLGIWQIGETAIYGPSGFSGIRGQVLREPDAEDWNSLVVQAVVSFLSADSAKKFYDRSFQRWSNCSNHKVNLTINGHPSGAWTFGTLTKTDTELTMPLSRTGDGGRSCNRALAVDSNVITDVAACRPSVNDQAKAIVGKIQSRIPA